jgi:ABC-type cobalamin/Fe3+-siderophores transport system ATPase subunit
MTTSTLRSAVSVTGLRKSFGGKVVLDGIDLDVAEGTIFSLLGPNGAGKTTAVQILSTLLSADAGEVHVAGFDVAHQPEGVRAAIGVTGQFSAVDNLLTTSVGSRGDPYDNALAESFNGLYKSELIHRRAWTGLNDVEYETLSYVDWFNNRRLHREIGMVPPAEFEARQQPISAA